MIDLILKIIGALTPLVLGGFGFYFNWKMNKIKLENERKLKERDEENARKLRERDEENDRKLNIKFDKMSERQQYLETGFFDMKQILQKHFDESETKDFVIDGIKAATEGEALNLIKSNFVIGANKKSMLTRWGKLMHDLASSFHKDGSRKENEIRRREILEQKELLIINDFNSFINDKIPEIKRFQGTDCRFSDFIDKTQLYGSFRVLIFALIQNNLSDKDYIDKFQSQTVAFCRALIIAQGEWSELEFAYRKNDKVA